jgi:hypothetical protein
MKREQLKELYIKYGLDESDIFNIKFGNSSKPIITRVGIEKIQAQLGINISYKIERITDDHKSCIILATGVITQLIDNKPTPKAITQSFGEVSPSNNTNKYPIAMAEKRALSRVVIKMAGLATYGIYGEDEADEFKQQK